MVRSMIYYYSSVDRVVSWSFYIICTRSIVDQYLGKNTDYLVHYLPPATVQLFDEYGINFQGGYIIIIYTTKNIFQTINFLI